MSALRLSRPDGSVFLVDLGPASAKGHVHDGGRRPAAGEIVVGESGTYTDASAYERVKRFRQRHGGRKVASA